jgi:hypothetical protein
VAGEEPGGRHRGRGCGEAPLQPPGRILPQDRSHCSGRSASATISPVTGFKSLVCELQGKKKNSGKSETSSIFIRLKPPPPPDIRSKQMSGGPWSRKASGKLSTHSMRDRFRNFLFSQTSGGFWHWKLSGKFTPIRLLKNFSPSKGKNLSTWILYVPYIPSNTSRKFCPVVYFLHRELFQYFYGQYSATTNCPVIFTSVSLACSTPLQFYNYDMQGESAEGPVSWSMADEVAEKEKCQHHLDRACTLGTAF